MIEEFKKYVEQFGEDTNIKRKYYHSLRVKNICRELGDQLKFSEKDSKAIEIIGLLHDYGRFKQWKEYQTFNDLKSIDHGDLAVEILFTDNEIKKYHYYEDDYGDIYTAIKYHNKLNFPNNLSEREKVFLKVIQDADKLDILYLVSIGEIRFLEEGDVSPKVKEAFNTKSLVDKKYRINDIDYALCHLALIFGLNFDYSFKYLKDKNIIETIYKNVTNKNKFKQYFEIINKFIDSKIANFK